MRDAADLAADPDVARAKEQGESFEKISEVIQRRGRHAFHARRTLTAKREDGGAQYQQVYLCHWTKPLPWDVRARRRAANRRARASRKLNRA